MAYTPYNKEGQMNKFEVEFYEKRNGEIPVEVFLCSLNIKLKVKIIGLISILQEEESKK